MTITETEPPSTEVEIVDVPDTGHVVRRDDSLNKMSALWDLAQRVANTDFVPAAYRNKPESVFASFMRGHEVGLEPFQALDSIDNIQGKATLKPEVMRALIRQQGHDYDIVEMTATSCTIKAHRKEWAPDRWSSYTFTIEDAKGLQLTGKDNWKKQPKVMLLARCTGLMSRADFADVIRGLSYTPDEILDSIETTATVVQTPTSSSPPAPAPAPVSKSGTDAEFADMSGELEKLRGDEKDVLREWWKTLRPKFAPTSVPAGRVQEIRHKIKEIIDARRPDNDPDSAATPVEKPADPDDEIIEAEIVDESSGSQTAVSESSPQGGTTRPTTRPPAPARTTEQAPPGKDTWTEALQQTCRSMGIDPAERNKLASKFLERNIRRPGDMTEGEISMFMDFLETGDYGVVNKAAETVANAFPGAEEVGAA